MESRKDGRIHIIWDRVGKENFDALNDLFQIFHKKFPEKEFRRLNTELSNKEETERTKLFREIVEQKIEILKRMEKYSMLQEQKDETKEEKKNII